MFPSIISTFNIVSASDRLNSPSHSALHNSVGSVLTQVQTVIGTDASTLGTIIGDLRNANSGGGGHVQTANKGGTGQTSYTKGDLLIATSSSVLSKLAVGIDGQALVANSSTASGVQWGNGAGNATLIIPRPAGGTLGTDTIVSVPPSSILQYVSLQEIPFPIRVNKISIMENSVLTQGNIKIGLYDTTGASVLSASVLTSIVVNGNSTFVLTTPVPSVLVSAGSYWVALTGTGIIQTYPWDITDAASGGDQILASVIGSPVTAGTLPAVGGNLSSAIVSSNIAWNVSGAHIVRLDT